LLTELLEILHLEEGESAEAIGGRVGEWIGLFWMTLQGANEGGYGFFVEAEEQRLGAGGGEDLVEKDLEVWIGNGFEAERRFAHFADAFTEFGNVFGAVMGVEAESGFEFVDGFGGEAGDEGPGEALKGVVVTFEARDALVHGKAGLGGGLEGAEAGQGREVLVTRVVHKSDEKRIRAVYKTISGMSRCISGK
jgi:hypothetical protein